MTDPQAWRPMAEFDPSMPAVVHDKLNDQVIAWAPERHRENFKQHAAPFEPGVVAWDGLLLDGWKPR